MFAGISEAEYETLIRLLTRVLAQHQDGNEM